MHGRVPVCQLSQNDGRPSGANIHPAKPLSSSEFGRGSASAHRRAHASVRHYYKIGVLGHDLHGLAS